MNAPRDPQKSDRDPIDVAVDEHKMPLMDHLVELRTRLIRSLGAVFAAFLVCFYFSEQIFGFLVQPLAHLLPAGRKMIYTALPEAFFTYVKVSMFGAFCLAFPIIAAQLWKFVAPGLYKHERMAFLPFLLATPILFIMGSALAYYVVFPLAFTYLLSFEKHPADGGLALESMPAVAPYLDTVMTLIMAFGISFEMPVLLVLLARVGIITADGLASKRRYAIVGAFAIAAVLTPPDIVSQVSLAIPIVVLYESSILTIRFLDKRKAKAAAAAT